MSKIFCEKYRPTEFSEVIGLDPEIPKLINNEIPHMLFVGPAGTGKTSVAKIIINKLDAEYLFLNTSKKNERGIDVIDTRIEPFATKASNKLKIVFLDEIDSSTPDFQKALRNFMVEHSRTTRFIATCNYINKLIDPLISRFSRFDFYMYDKTEKFIYLKKIVGEEKISIDDETLMLLVKKCKDDVRAMVNFLNKNRFKEKIVKEDFSYQDLALKILAQLKDNKWFDTRKELINQDLDYSSLILDFDKIVFFNNDIPEGVKKKTNILLSDYQCKMYSSFDKELCFGALMAELEEVLNW